MNKFEEKIVKRMEELSKDKETLKEMEKEILYYKLKYPLNWAKLYIANAAKLAGQKDELQAQGYDGVMVWNDEKPDETKFMFGKEQVIKGRKAGWSEICVFDPENIHKLEVKE